MKKQGLWVILAGLVAFSIWVVAVDQTSDAGAYGAGQAVGENIRQYAWVILGVLMLWFFGAQFANGPPTWFRRHPFLTAAWIVVVGVMALGSTEGDGDKWDASSTLVVGAFMFGVIVLGIGRGVDGLRSIRSSGPSIE